MQRTLNPRVRRSSPPRRRIVAAAASLQAADVVEFRALAEQLRALIDTLPPRQAKILSLRYGLHNGQPHSRREVAERVGLTPERVGQPEKEALAQLRDPQRHEPKSASDGVLNPRVCRVRPSSSAAIEGR